MNLNLGSGTNRRQDYISVDLYIPEADEHWDLTKPLPVEDESVDNIYACHVIEHFSPAEWEDMRKDWMRVIKPGGSIEIRCPDIFRVAKALLTAKGEELQWHLSQFYGLQHAPGEQHRQGVYRDMLIRSFPDWHWYELEPADDTELHMRYTKPTFGRLADVGEVVEMEVALAKDFLKRTKP